jgi:hypothetical protein
VFASFNGRWMIVLVDRTGTHMNRLVFGNSEVNFEMTYDGGFNLKVWPDITHTY